MEPITLPTDPQLLEMMDRAVEDEVRRGYKVVDVPDDILVVLKADKQIDPTKPVFHRIRLVKLTEERKGLIRDAKRKTYQKLLQDKEYLSTAQVRALNVERGEWSDAMEAEMESLRKSTQHLVAELFIYGYDSEAWMDELRDHIGKVNAFLDRTDDEGKPLFTEVQRAEIVAVFTRWQAYNPDQQADYDKNFAEAQGRPKYDPEIDAHNLAALFKSNEMIDILSKVEELRGRIHVLTQLHKEQERLAELVTKQESMYAGTVERLATETEQCAQVFYVIQVLDSGKPQPLVKDLKEIWSLAPEALSWLIREVYLFLHSVSPEMEAYLSKLGFLGAPRRNLSLAASDVSPAEPSSKPDTNQSVETDPASLVSSTPTT